MADYFGLKEALSMNPYYTAGATMQSVTPKFQGNGWEDILAASLYGLASGGLTGYGQGQVKREQNLATQGIIEALSQENPDYAALGEQYPSASSFLAERQILQADEDRKNKQAIEMLGARSVLDVQKAIAKERALQAEGLKAKPGAAIANRNESRKDRNALAIFREDSKLLREYAKASEIPPAALIQRYKAGVEKFGIPVISPEPEGTPKDTPMGGTVEKLKTSLLPEGVASDEPIQYASDEIIPEGYNPEEQALLAGGYLGGARDLVDEVGEVPEEIPAEFAGLWGSGKKKKEDSPLPKWVDSAFTRAGSSFSDRSLKRLDERNFYANEIDKILKNPLLVNERMGRLLSTKYLARIGDPDSTVREFEQRATEFFGSMAGDLIKRAKGIVSRGGAKLSKEDINVLKEYTSLVRKTNALEAKTQLAGPVRALKDAGAEEYIPQYFDTYLPAAFSSMFDVQNTENGIDIVPLFPEEVDMTVVPIKRLGNVLLPTEIIKDPARIKEYLIAEGVIK